MRYNPYKQFTGSFIPNWLLERPEIGAVAKLVFARLSQYAGKNGCAFPAQDVLATEIGSSLRTVSRAFSELETAGLIESERRNMGQSNAYFFLRHPWIPADEEDAKMAQPISQNGVQVTPPLAGLHMEKRIIEENQSNSSFKAFWEAYPNRVHKGTAEKAWKKVSPDLLPKILAGLEWQKKAEKWRNGFIPNPATWLNARGWEDEPMRPISTPIIVSNESIPGPDFAALANGAKK